MKIIILNGDSNTGKTTTMGMVFVKLHLLGGKVINFNRLESTSDMDFEAVFAFPADEKMLKVAVFSKGDVIAECNAAINRYSPNMDVLIIAYSTKVRKLVIPAKDKAVCLQKTPASPAISEVKANTKDCQSIISNII